MEVTMSKQRASLVQIVGAVLVAVGVATFDPGAGLVVAGVSAVVFGVAAERSAA